MASNLSLFVSQLSSLGKELNDMYPDDMDIKMAKNSIETLKILNPKKLYEVFSSIVVPFKEQIINRDEGFFLNINVKGGDMGDGYSITTVMNLKKYWSGMSDSTKECMWQYFGVLVKLSEKIAGN
jgi:hypothetical protein